ncbi:MAG: DUF4407 domain-containing protein, partial [Mycobacterium sp.]|nr:DUF4407 domain-containing protein [Mycobacterium sp.]
ALEAASRSALELPASAEDARDEEESDNLPAPVEFTDADANQRVTPTIPVVTRAAARWIRPLVPTFVARAIDTTTQPLRAARQVFEEVEEVTFLFKRTRKVSVDSEESLRQPQESSSAAADDRRRIQSSTVESARRESADYRPVGTQPKTSPLGSIPAREPQPSLIEPDRRGQLGAPEGPRQLPPGE